MMDQTRNLSDCLTLSVNSPCRRLNWYGQTASLCQLEQAHDSGTAKQRRRETLNLLASKGNRRLRDHFNRFHKQQREDRSKDISQLGGKCVSFVSGMLWLSNLLVPHSWCWRFVIDATSDFESSLGALQVVLYWSHMCTATKMMIVMHGHSGDHVRVISTGVVADQKTLQYCAHLRSAEVRAMWNLPSPKPIKCLRGSTKASRDYADYAIARRCSIVRIKHPNH